MVPPPRSSTSAPPAVRSRRGGRVATRLTSVAAAAVLVMGGCRADATVTIEVGGRTGTVTARMVIDREAVSVLGGNVGEGAQLDDLRRAGWEIGRPRGTDAGGVVVEASKGFTGADDLARVVTELSGTRGPLGAFRLWRDRSFASVHYRLRGVADLGSGATGFANVPDLAERLEEAGVDSGRVEALLARRSAEGLRLRVVVDLPGEKEASWEARPGERVEVAADSTVSDPRRPLLLVLSVVLAAAAFRTFRSSRRKALPG